MHSGANSGIGYETSVALAKEKSTEFEVLMGCRSVKKGEEALAEMKKSGISADHVKVVQIDVCDKKSIEKCVETVTTEYGKLDALINNAGIVAYDAKDTMESLRRTFETNVFAPMIVTEAFEPLLKKSEKPYIVYVSSSLGSVTMRLDPNDPYRALGAESYRMSKAAVDMLAACHRYNFADWCKVIAFNPGWCISNLTGAAGVEQRKKGGARPASDPAQVLRDVLLGKKDDDVAKNGMLDVDGGVIPW